MSCRAGRWGSSRWPWRSPGSAPYWPSPSAAGATSSGATSGSDKGDDTKKADDATGKDSGSGDKSGSDSGSDAKDGEKASPGEDASASGGSKGDDGSASGSGSAVAQTYRSAQGFSIGLPKGWKYQSSDAAGARFTGPDGQKLLVGWTTTPKDDPVADWKNQERGMVRPQH